MYYRNSQAAVVVYDIQNSDSFQRAKCWVTTLKNQVNIWWKIIECETSNSLCNLCVFLFCYSQNPPTQVIALAANKSEPLKCHSAVALSDAMNYANENKLIFMETSAKTPLNIQELFVTIGMYY